MKKHKHVVKKHEQGSKLLAVLPLCPSCKRCPARVDSDVCPLSEAMGGESSCHCCGTCRSKCAWEI